MKRVRVLGVVAVVAVAGLMGIVFPAREAPLEAQAKDVLAGFTMRVEIDGIAESLYRGVEGLSVETQVVEFRDGADPNTIRKIPGTSSWGDVVLKFGPGPLANALWAWYSGVLAGEVSKRGMAVILLDEKGTEVVRYLLQNAWPAKWEGPRQVALNTAIPIESVTVVAERITRQSR